MKILLRRLALLSALAIPSSLFAQAGTFDLAAGGGLAEYFSDGSHSTKGLFEASALFQFLPHVGVGAEYTYSPVATINQNFTGYTLTGSAHLDHIGAVVRVPFGEAAHVEPYAAFHVGAVHESASVQVTNIVTSSSATYAGGYGGGGVGVSLFLTRHLGVRPEVRYEYLRINGSHENEVDATASLFYRFGPGRS